MSLHLFEGYGVELEYMIVEADTLNVLPKADELLYRLSGDAVADVERGEIALSNELVLHVIELKTNGPVKSLDGLAEKFQEQAQVLNRVLQGMNAQLMPTAMHPWMDPHVETKIWPHEYNEVYRAYDRIFGCRGHGWSNLQSTHINLPFAGDEEFARLHAAIRVLLPILPAIAASSPLVELQATGLMDNRMEFYAQNSIKIPSVTAGVIPEPIFSIDEYHQKIFQRVYSDIAPYDPEGVLQHEFLNARGAIARFTRNAIEIRVIDVQECPQADIAIVEIIVQVLKDLVNERWSTLPEQKSWESDPLREIFLAAMRDAEHAPIENPAYGALFGFPAEPPYLVKDLWAFLLESAKKEPHSNPARLYPAETLIHKGPLSRRILRALNRDHSKKNVSRIYGELCGCLEQGRMFVA